MERRDRSSWSRYTNIKRFLLCSAISAEVYAYYFMGNLLLNFIGYTYRFDACTALLGDQLLTFVEKRAVLLFNQMNEMNMAKDMFSIIR